MKAPEWYRKARGAASLRPPPPGVTAKPPPGPPQFAPPGRSVPALPTLPSAPKAAAASGQQPGILPLPPPLALLPPPPAAADGGLGGTVALQLPPQPQLPDLPTRAPPSRPVGLVKAAPARSGADEKSFLIPGLQNRQYTEEELYLAFEMIDLDRHGNLGPEELQRALSLCGEGHTLDSEVAEMIRLSDPDGNGRVDFKEFIRAFKDPPTLFRNFDLQRREPRSSEPMASLAATTLAALPAPRPHSSGGSNSGSDHAPRTPQQAPTPPPLPRDPRPEAIAAIMGNKKLKPQFIKSLYQRFVEIDTNENGLISYEAFCVVLRKPQNSAIRRAFDVFDVDQTGELDLQQFVVSLSMFTKSRADDKLRFAFMMYDEEQQGSLARADLAEMLKAIAPHFPAQLRDAHVSRVYAMHSLHPNARVAFADLQAYLAEHEDELIPSTGEEASGAEAASGGEA